MYNRFQRSIINKHRNIDLLAVESARRRRDGRIVFSREDILKKIGGGEMFSIEFPTVMMRIVHAYLRESACIFFAAFLEQAL